jgi:hypothetical protein
MAHPHSILDDRPRFEGKLGDGNVVITKRLSSLRVVRYFVRENAVTQAWLFDREMTVRGLRYYRKTLWFPGDGLLETPSDVLQLARHYAASNP